MDGAGSIPERRRRVKMVAWSSVWLVVLGSPASHIWHGNDRPAWVAAGVLATFVALYLTLLWVQSDPTRGMPVKLALLAPLVGIALASSLEYRQTWPFLFFFVSVAVAVTLPPNRAVFGIMGVTVVDAIVVSRPGLGETNTGSQIVGVFMAGLLVMFIFRMIRLITELNAAREELARLAVADERLRFARDLHDLLGQTLSLIVVKSEAVRRLVHHDADAAARESGDIELVSRQALAEVREAVTNYRDRSLENELEGARVALLAAGIEATIHHGAERLPDAIESVLGWTVREGVTNVVRHSNGRHCAIDVRQHNGNAVLEICDDGSSEAGPAEGRDAATGGGGGDHDRAGADPAGADPAGADPAGADPALADPVVADHADGIRAELGGDRAGNGLRGLAERLAAAHGRLEAGRRPDGGFRLAVTVPLPSGRREPG